MYSRDELFQCSLECYFCVYFSRCFATWEINTKITLSWVLKQFVTRVHTLFYIYLLLNVMYVKEYGWNEVHQSDKNNNITITNKTRQNIIKKHGHISWAILYPSLSSLSAPYIPVPRGMTIIPALPPHCHDNQPRFPHIHKTYLMTVRMSGDESTISPWGDCTGSSALNDLIQMVVHVMFRFVKLYHR